MATRTRRLILWILVITFLLTTSAVVAYADGWRLDFSSFAPEKVGAIYIRSFPSKAEIHLNGKSIENKSWFFQNGTLINNLFPKNYEVTLSSAGYRPWRENVAVYPSLVSEIKYAVLVPEKSELISNELVTSFNLINNDLLQKNASGTILWRGRSLRGDTVIGKTDDGKRLLTYEDKTGSYWWYNLDDYTATSIIPALKKMRFQFNAKTDSLATDPADSQKLFYLTPTRLISVDVNRLEAVTLDSSPSMAQIASSRFWIAWTTFDEKTNSTSLTLYDRFLKTKRVKDGLLAGRNTTLRFNPDGTLGLIQEDGGFSLYNIAKNKLDKVASDVKDFVSTEDGGKVAALEHQSIEVFSLENQDDYWRFNIPNIGEVRSIEWYGDAFHLFIHYSRQVSFLDLGDRSLINFITLADTPYGTYDAKTNKLYFLDGTELVALTFPK